MLNNELTPHHCAISVIDLDETIEWYESILGFKTIKKFDIQRLNASVAFLEMNEFILEVFKFNDVKPLPDYRKSLSGDLKVVGMKHFTFSVNDVHAATKELKEKGVQFLQDPILGGSNHMYAFFLDNNGIMIEIIEKDEYKK